MINAGLRYDASVAGGIDGPVTCERCGCEYSYVMTGRGWGTGRSPLFLTNASARQAAVEGASPAGR